MKTIRLFSLELGRGGGPPPPPGGGPGGGGGPPPGGGQSTRSGCFPGRWGGGCAAA